ncbi:MULTISPECIES: HPr family phosphocarrier protein [Bifidobacterium]|uniref:PTS galactitol transporter subunit IIC n=2 Tax=Bifidobacterium TaxID=1678 RepID=A0A2M9HDP5_9BIFI|nr:MULTISPECIES: HPr family phosphocarrier protein [Bifidobacterium]MBT1163693.1 HPr family phosphocarrier protein [Bifidobacterium felsineum]NEG55716.1 HPr family phosphocarrier protein [Bifidobacterium platyrrhinorum]PJM74935.1 PTS galactitol transporter subunit IIC [Bifidobacterium simiarum]
MSQEFTFTVSDPEGMHARPAGLLVAKAQEYQSSIIVTRDGKSVDAKRIFGVMGLGVKQGDEVTVKVQGNDEVKAAAEFEQFLKENL